MVVPPDSHSADLSGAVSKRTFPWQSSPRTTIKKQVSLFVCVADYMAIKRFAAQTGTTINGLVRDWIEPQLKRIRDLG